MTITVIIPTLNEERTLSPTLAHTLQQGFDEIIVVDGDSQDQTVEMAKTHHDRSEPGRVNVLTSSRGRARQMNAGANVAQSEVLLFLHADTQLPGDARTAIEQALENPPHVGGRFDVRFEKDQGMAWVISRMMNLRSRRTGIATGDQAIFVRRSTFQRLGGFTDIPIMEDIDFSRRLKQVGQLAALRSQVVTSFRRWEKCGPIRMIVLMWTLRFLYWLGLSPWTLQHFYRTVR